MDLTQIWHALIASGPVASVLGVAVWQLWKANKEERAQHLVERERLRNEYLASLKVEQDRHQKEEDEIRREYIDTLKSMTAHVKGEHDVP